MIEPEKILKETLLTEKASALAANLNQHTFEVYPGVNRTQVKQAVEQVFKVDVASVNIINVRPRLKSNRTRRGKPGVVSGMKKAVVTLREGSSIEMV